jgi:hypothetical protein
VENLKGAPFELPVALLAYVRQGWKRLLGRNTLANGLIGKLVNYNYNYKTITITIKSFITLSPADCHHLWV